MNYQQTLDYMYSKLPMFSRVGGNAIKHGFTNILALCEMLNNPQQHIRFVHVAGTNGKGSVSHMLASVFQSAGYKTGLYTSPHLKDFRERIKIDGQMIPEADVINFIEKMQTSIETINPSFFEITVAMAFDHFSKNNTDIAIIETGLGGRLDSTNIITPELSVITNIGLDHVHVLGDTLDKIAAEKAGIIKKEIPAVIGEKVTATKEVFTNKANEVLAPMFFANDYWEVMDWQYDAQTLSVSVAEAGKTDHKKYLLDLTGQYQTKNLITVLESCRQLRALGFNLSETAVAQGLQRVKKQTGLHGRWETIHQHPHIILDVAHNESGMQELLKQLEITTYHHLHIVLGMVKDKDVDTVLSMMPKTATYYFTNANLPRALPAADLSILADKYDLRGQVFGDVNIAIAQAKAQAHKDDLILVCGSVFLVGEVN